MRTQIRRKPNRCCRPLIGKDSFSSLPTSRRTNDTYVRERFRILKQTRCEIRRTLRGARARHLRGLHRELRRGRRRRRRLRAGSKEIGRWPPQPCTKGRSLRRKKICPPAANRHKKSI